MPYHLATAPSVAPRLVSRPRRGYERPHPLRDELQPRHSCSSGSGGKRHLGALLAALPMNQARTLWHAGAAGEVAAYRFIIESLNTFCATTRVFDKGVRSGSPSGRRTRVHRDPERVQKAQNPPTSVSGDGRLLRWVEKSIYRLNHPAPEMEHLPQLQQQQVGALMVSCLFIIED